MHNVYTQYLFGKELRNDWSHKEMGIFKTFPMTLSVESAIFKWVFKQVVGKHTEMPITSERDYRRMEGQRQRGLPPAPNLATWSNFEGKVFRVGS